MCNMQLVACGKILNAYVNIITENLMYINITYACISACVPMKACCSAYVMNVKQLNSCQITLINR